MTRVLLLTQEHCAACDQAKEMLQRLAQEFSLEIQTTDFASADGQVLALGGGLLFPPGVFIDDQPFSYGRPSEGKLRQKLAALNR